MIYEMNACPLCDESVPEDRPRYRISLEIEDMTRSTQQFSGGDAEVSRYCVDRQVCQDCWDDLRRQLS